MSSLIIDSERKELSRRAMKKGNSLNNNGEKSADRNEDITSRDKERINVLLREYDFLRQDTRMLNNRSITLLPFIASTLTILIWYATTKPIIFVVIPFVTAIFVLYLLTLRCLVYIFEAHIERIERRINSILGGEKPWMSFETVHRHKGFTLLTEPGTPFFLFLAICLILIYIIGIVEGFQYLRESNRVLAGFFLAFCLATFALGVIQYVRTIRLFKKLRQKKDSIPPQ